MGKATYAPPTPPHTYNSNTCHTRPRDDDEEERKRNPLAVQDNQPVFFFSKRKYSYHHPQCMSRHLHTLVCFSKASVPVRNQCLTVYGSRATPRGETTSHRANECASDTWANLRAGTEVEITRVSPYPDGSGGVRSTRHSFIRSHSTCHSFIRSNLIEEALHRRIAPHVCGSHGWTTDVYTW